MLLSSNYFHILHHVTDNFELKFGADSVRSVIRSNFYILLAHEKCLNKGLLVFKVQYKVYKMKKDRHSEPLEEIQTTTTTVKSSS